MTDILIGFFTIALILLCFFAVLVILMQKPNANAGMGAALGGGAAESAFGAQTGNILTRTTIIATAIFFVLSFCLYLGHMAKLNDDSFSAQLYNDELLKDDASEEPQEATTEPVNLGLTDDFMEQVTLTGEGVEEDSVEIETTVKVIEEELGGVSQAVESESEALSEGSELEKISAPIDSLPESK